MTTARENLLAHPVVVAADAFAEARHGAIDHRRKYTNTPYIEHPRAVAAIVAGVAGATPEMVAAALLHDTIEDTGTTKFEIIEAFGMVVARLVVELTDVTTKADGNRATRKGIERERLRNVSAEAKTIKLADLIHNSQSILEHDPNFAVVYMREKRELLDALDGGSPVLMAEAKGIVEGWMAARAASREFAVS